MPSKDIPLRTRRALMLSKDIPLRTRRALMLSKDIPLRTRRALTLYKVYGDSALLVLNGTLLNSVNALLALSQQNAPISEGAEICEI